MRFPDDFIEIEIKGKIIHRCTYCERQKLENKKIRSEDWKREKENLTDYYVARTLQFGSKLKMQHIPKQLIEAKRAVIQVKRLTDQLNAPLKKCFKHGDLYREDVIKSGKTKAGTQCYKCKKCMAEIHKAHYEINRLEIRKKHEKYRNENREKVKASKLKSKEKHLVKYLASKRNRDAIYRAKNFERINTRQFQDAQNLSDVYMKKTLTKRSKLKSHDIPQALVDAKRAILSLKRKIKRKKEERLYQLLKEAENGENS